MADKNERLIHLVSIDKALVGFWKTYFNGVETVKVSEGDIFSYTADAIISPANSFGFMDGGIDALYTQFFGPVVQQRVQKRIRNVYLGELPVGEAFDVETDNSKIPHCICAPTMRTPSNVADSLNAYLSFRAALIVVKYGGIGSVLCPGMATGTGRMPPDRCARQMRVAWDRIFGAKKGIHPVSIEEAAYDERKWR